MIIGNPPFLGAKRLKPERGADYVNAVRKLYPEVPGMADYCVYWIRRAADHLPDCTAANPFAGRAGLVGTQNIRNNQSRVGGLDHVVKSGTIVEAVDNQPWSGEANVSVSIANWVKGNSASVLPATRQLWVKVVELPGAKKRKKGFIASKQYDLSPRKVSVINAALSDQSDTTAAKPLACNERPQKVFQGNTPGDDGFVLDEATQYQLRIDERSAAVIFPYLTGRELLDGDGTPERWLIDFEQRTILQAQQFPRAFAYVQEHVLPTIQSKADKEAEKNAKLPDADKDFTRKNQLERWWMHWRGRADRITAASRLKGRFIACSRVTKRPIFVFVDLTIRPGDALQTFIFDDDYSFGILQSSSHWQWFVTKCSKLTERLRYTPESVFDTFPWPQSPTKKQIDAVAAAAVKVRAVRAEALAVTTGGLRAVYRTLELPGKHPLKEAHADLDAAVLAAYGFSAKKDLLAQLLALNLDVAAKEKAGEPVTAPGVPPAYGDPAKLITDDCIRP